MRKQEAATAVFRQKKPRDVPPCYTRFYALHMGKPSLQCREAHPVLARQLRVRLHKALRSRTLMSLRAIPLSLGLGALRSSSAPAGNPSSLRVGHPDVASGRDSYADGSLNRREAHPVLARQLRVRLHKALRSRTRGAENAHALITHRLKQTQQLRRHVGCRQ